MAAVPGSRLLLPVPGAEAHNDAREMFLDRLSACGFPVDRIDLCGRTETRREYLERFSQIDIALDTWPFNGITTTCDGLWMGVPAVSLAGNTSVSRAGRSILTAAGLGHLAVKSPEDFVEAAVELVRSATARSDLRTAMRERLTSSPLMDHRGFTARLECAYARMCEDWIAA